MRHQEYVVKLSVAQRGRLEGIIRRGKALPGYKHVHGSCRTRTRAQGARSGTIRRQPKLGAAAKTGVGV